MINAKGEVLDMWGEKGPFSVRRMFTAVEAVRGWPDLLLPAWTLVAFFERGSNLGAQKVLHAVIDFFMSVKYLPGGGNGL